MRRISYRGVAIEKISDERWVPTKNRYKPETFYVVPSLQDDFDLLRDAKAAIDRKFP